MFKDIKKILQEEAFQNCEDPAGKKPEITEYQYIPGINAFYFSYANCDK
jgi:hypothetical protein